MAELNVTREDDNTVPGTTAAAGAQPVPVTDPDHLLEARTPAAHPAAATSDDPDVARRQIEETRARMSSTIDQLEGALARKREHIEEKLDVMAPVREKAREHVWPALGGIFLGGLLLGYLTGDDDDDDEVDARRVLMALGGSGALASAKGGMGDEYWQERAETWEHRARRLMDIAHRQEAELRSVRGRGRAMAARRQDVEVDVEIDDLGYARPRREGYDGMPLSSDSHPPRDEMGGGPYGGHPLSQPV